MRIPEDILDVLIIGAGPIGMACAIEAKKNNLRCQIIEKGCLTNSIYRYPANMTFFSTSEKLEIGNVPFVSHLPKPNRSEALEYYRRVATTWDLDINLYEKVVTVKKDETFVIKTDKFLYRAKNIVIATGFYDLPYLLNIPGEQLPKVKHYFEEPHPYFKQKVVIVGAANSAIDAALEIYRKGGEVTLVIRESEISPRVKYWVKPDIENRIAEGSIRAYFNANLKSVYPNKVEIAVDGGRLSLPNDFVLALTGYQPSFEFLESMGVKIGSDDKKTPVHNTDTMETNVEGVYLAGVICGGLQTNKWFIENSKVHAEVIMQSIVGSKNKY